MAVAKNVFKVRLIGVRPFWERGWRGAGHSLFWPTVYVYGYVPLNRVWFPGSWGLNRVYNSTIEHLEQGVSLDQGVNFGSVSTSVIAVFLNKLMCPLMSRQQPHKIFFVCDSKINKINIYFPHLYCIYYLKRTYLLKQGIFATVLNRVMKNSLLS